MSTAPVKPESASLRNLLIAASVIGALALMASVMPLMMSPMIFDSGESPAAWGWFVALWLMPVVLIAGLAIGWMGFARRSRRIAVAGLVLFALPILATIGILVMAGF